MTALKELQSYTFTAKYARWNEKKQRRETWKEAVDRVLDMMLERYAELGIDEDIKKAYGMMYRKQILGSQRALQFGGKPALKKNARIFNCVGSYCDRLRFFQEYFWLLLCGCGAGFSVQKHHVAKLPPLTCSFQSNVKTFIIPDTIEGWANALGVLLSNYSTEPIYPSYGPEYCGKVVFDYSEIRPKGSPLSSGVGKAPGPDGLRQALENIQSLLDRIVTNGEIADWNTIDAYDICMHASDAVLSGGVRRSASIAIFSPDDEEMATAKIGNWRNENPQRARSNNSALLLRGSTDYETFSSLIKHVKEYGEPGFVWADDREFLINPCAEIGFYCYDYNGNSGWQGCNLSTINGATIADLDDFLERAQAASLIGTLQAGFTDLDYLGETSENIFRREALLGVSITGVMDNFEIALNPENQRQAAEMVNTTNEKYAKIIGINPAARTTCLKPEGTSSCVLGTASGIGPNHAKRFLRLVQANHDENVYKFFKQANPEACELSVWSASKTDDVIRFPIEIPDGSKTKNQLPALQLLEIVKSTQENWVGTGKRKHLCTKPWLSHNVSNTITVCEDEWEDVTQYIYDNRNSFTGVTLMPLSGDKDYPQAPFCAVHTSREIVKEYGDAAVWCSGLIELALRAFGNDLWKACDAILKSDPQFINGNTSSNELFRSANKMEVWERSQKFAKKYFDGDAKKLTYCMKDVYNWKLYSDLRRTFTPVKYTEMVELEDNTTPEQELACVGGACEI